MAEPTKVKIYNFGDRKLDYGKYITNLENNVESYLQNQKDTEGWDDNRAQEFRNSFGEIISHFRGDYQGKGTRFSTNQMGSIVDSEGVLTNTDADDFYYNKKGEKINRELYDALKDKKKRRYNSFEANREVAEYFRRIGSYMKDYEDTTEKFDLSKHGFNKWLMDREAPGGTFNYQNYWDLDPVDVKTGKRDTKQRAAQAKKWMDEYISDMGKRTDLSFEGNKSFSSLEDYLLKAKDVANQWGNPTWDANDKISAQRLGIDNDFMTKFFGTEGTPETTPEENAEIAAQRVQQAKEEEEKKSAEAKDREYKAWVDSQYNDYVNKKYQYTKQVPYYSNLYNWDRYYKDGQLTDDYHRMLGNLVVYHKGHNKSIMQMDDKEKGEVLGQLLNQYVNHLYDPKYNIANIPLNNHYMYLLQLIDQHYAQDLGDGSYYIPSTKPGNSALIFDLNAKTFYHTFIGDIPSVWDLRKLEYYNRVNGVSPSAQYYEEGGIIKAQDGAALLNAGASKYFANRAQQRHDQLQTKATAKGRTIEQQELAERKAHTPFAGFEDDNTWSTEEYARLTAAGADITAAIAAFVPGYGTAVSGIAGVGSTIANAIADKADDSVSTGQWWKNLGMNLGMDVLGLVPGVGAAGKFTKILRNVGRTIPRVIAVLGTMGAFLNSDAIMASLKKSISDPANLTVEDWQNIAQGIGVATGLAAGTGRHLQRKANEAGSTTDFAAIRMRSKTNPKIVENKIVGAKTARDLRAAKTNDEIREILYRDNPWLKDTYDLDIKGGLYGRELTWKRPTWADKSPIGTKESLARIYDVRRDAKGNLYGYTGKWKSDLALYGDRSRDAFGRVRMQSYQNKGRGTMLADEKMAYMEDLGRIRELVGSPLDRTGTRRVGTDDDFNEAFWKSRRDLDDTPNKSRLLQDQQDIRKYYEEQQKPFRDQHGSTTDITGRLNAAKTLKGSPDYQTAVGQHATLTQQHADLVARHQPMIDSYKQQIQQIDNDLVFYNSQRTAASAKDRALANREIKRLTKLRQQLQSEHDTLAAELLASETKVKNNQAKIDEGSDTRIAELEALETQSKAHDETLANIDKQISRLEQLGGKHTPSYVELMDKRAKDGKITFTDERGKQFSVDAIRAMRLAGIKKNGGILDAVEKFQNSGKIKSPMRDVQNPGKVNWYQDMFTNGLNATKTGEDGTALPNWFDQWTVDNMNQFNQLQTDWNNNFQATGYQEGSNKAVRNPGVMDRQPKWEATGGNAPIADMLKPGPNGESPRLVGNGGTEDKPDENGKFGADGVFGQQEFLRHAGRVSDWKGKEAELAEFNKKLNERGLVYEPDRSGNTDMMMLYKLNEDAPEDPVKKADEKTPKNTQIDVAKKKLEEEKKKGGITFGKARQYLGNPDLLANLQLFGTLNQIDDEVDLQRKKQPHLLQVGDDHKYVRKNNAAIYNARKAQGLLMHMASQPITSDGGQQMAYAADQFTKMLDYGLQGDQLADEKFWETMDAEKELRMKNRKAREDNANANSRTLAEHQHDWINTLQVARYKKWSAINTRMMEQRAKLEGKVAEAESAQKAADRMMLENDVTYNLQKYADQFGVTPEEIEVWNKVQAGTSAPSSLSPEDKVKWESVYRKVLIGKQLLSAQQSGADISAFAQARSMAKPAQPTNPTAYNSNTPSYLRLKEGGKTAAKAKIKVAKIRERIKNADRAAKSIDKHLDRVQKTVESINKRMYGIKR